jgi:hypothetical protein
MVLGLLPAVHLRISLSRVSNIPRDHSHISKEITMNIYSVLDSDDDEKPKQQAKKAAAAAPAAAPAKGESHALHTNAFWYIQFSPLIS